MAPNKENAEDQPVPRVLTPDEVVTRFIYTNSNIQKTKARPKPGVFYPPRTMDLSVVHSSGLSHREIWEIAERTRGNQPCRDTIRGRADIPVQSLADVKLRALRDDKPFKRHTCVIDWPIGSDENDAKALWNQICLTLSEDIRISLVLPVNSTKGT
jgi:hypothetical protein